ncbi:uncharacterized protein [Labrus bergylta]|uniref:uncharacterized protein n=1 Tax=Labrus bergylta TaxID=56723 RepID=UPI0033144652
MASSSVSPSPALSCSTCQMLSYSSSSFSDNDTCKKCSLFLALEARVSELERRLCTIESESSYAAVVSQPPVAGAGRHSLASPPVAPEQPGGSGWITVRGKHSRKSKHTVPHQPLHVSNKFSPLSDTPAENKTLIIGDSIVRNMKLAKSAGIVRCIPGARAGDIASHLKLLTKTKGRFDTIVIHVGTNDSRLCQSEVTKVNVESVCTFAKTMSDSVVFSGPLPNQTIDDMYSRMSCEISKDSSTGPERCSSCTDQNQEMGPHHSCPGFSALAP